MYVRNFKLNGKMIFKIVFVILTILIFIMFAIGVINIINSNERITSKSEGVPQSEINTISAANYTNVLKTVHDNMNQYIGKKIKFVGFVYRLYDFSNDQFVLARQMIVSPDLQAVVVGFLCQLNGAEKYKDGCWVEIEGTITKGEYHGEIPVIEIEKIKETKTPNDEYVYPPDESYVPTSATL